MIIFSQSSNRLKCIADPQGHHKQVQVVARPPRVVHPGLGLPRDAHRTEGFGRGEGRPQDHGATADTQERCMSRVTCGL